MTMNHTRTKQLNFDKNTSDAPEHSVPFLASLPARAYDRRFALAIATLSVIVFTISLPFAKLPLAKVWAFIPMYQTAQIINDLITAIIIFGQFSILRIKALAVLASGYLFVAFVAASHTLSFPGLFAPSGLIGGGTQTTAWLYMFWHTGFPVFVIGYSLLKARSAQCKWPVGGVISFSVLAVFALSLAISVLATAGESLLPAIMAGNRYTEAMFYVVAAVWVVSAFAIIVVLTRQSHTVLDIWLLVVLCAWTFDITLAAWLNAGRFDLGFYMGRAYGLLAATFVLVMLLIENGRLYARLGETQVELAASNRHLQSEIELRNETEQALQRACDELEYRVAERTANLEVAIKELESFSYSVSHDLKTPLRAVLGLAEILKEDHGKELSNEAKGILQMIGDNADRMRQLIDDLLSFSRIAREDILRQEFDTEPMVRKVMGTLLQDTDHAVRYEIHALPMTCGDPSLLRQVWENLLSNAIKFSSTQPEPHIEIGGHANEAESFFFVKDNGVGFDMAYYDKLFGIFQRLHQNDQFSGTGVGLAIVQRIITRHGGRVWAESHPDKGATFFFTIPQEGCHG